MLNDGSRMLHGDLRTKVRNEISSICRTDLDVPSTIDEEDRELDEYLLVSTKSPKISSVFIWVTFFRICRDEFLTQEFC